MVLLCCVAAAAVVPVRWLDAQLHTDAYAESARSMIQQGDSQRAIGGLVSAALASSGQSVPPQVLEAVQSQVPALMRTPEAADIWASANLAARDALLNGSGGEVAIDLGALMDPLSQRLSAEGITLPARFPTENARIVLADSSAVAQVREAARLTAALTPVLPFVAGGLLLLALLISPRRWATLAVAGIGVALLTLAEVLAIPLVEDFVVAGVNNDIAQLFLRPLVEAFATSLRAELFVMLGGSALIAVASVVPSALTARRREPRPTH